jgi:hypothetical protein
LAGCLCVPERVAWFESHGTAQWDLHHQEREDRGADQREREVEGGEGEQHVLVEHVLDERDDGVGKAESEGIPITQPTSATVRPSVAKIRRTSRAWAPMQRRIPISRVRSSTTMVRVLISATMLIATTGARAR